jgi:glycosyltransferase involved in cell wall biosynthesis
MRIGIDAREIERGVTTGIGRALKVFLDQFEELSTSHECILFSTVPLPYSSGSRIRNRVHPGHQTIVWDQLHLPRLIRQEQVDLFYSPYYKRPLLTDTPTVTAIFDLMYLVCECYADRLSFMARHYYATVGKLMAHRARAIFTCSHYSKEEIRAFYGLPDERVRVIPLGLDGKYRPENNPQVISEVCRRAGIERPYLLYSGSFKPHKNVPTLVAAFREIAKRRPEMQLVLAGSGGGDEERVRQMASSEGLTRRVIMTGPVSDDMQRALYSAAQVFVMPSLYEGFGYPPLEAMACGAPVVCSNVTSLPEVVGDAGILIDARDHHRIARGVLALVDSPQWRKQLQKKGLDRVRAFSERTYAQRLLELLLSVHL